MITRAAPLFYRTLLFAAALLPPIVNVAAADEYMVIDISDGYLAGSYPVSYYNTASLPDGVTHDNYKIDKLLLKKISAGTFMMGSPESEVGRPSVNPDEDLHQVTLTDDFYIGVFEITQEQYDRVSGTSDTGKQPVYGQSFDQLNQQFLDPLESKTILNAGWSVDLPTEAQWEYACRAGTQTAYSFGADAAQLGSYAWYVANSGTGIQFPSEVGTKVPNPWGLYDMHGNVREYCRDAYNAALGTNVQTNPVYTTGTGFRVAKGGSAWNEAEVCRSAARHSMDESGTETGIRICVIIPPPPPTYALTVINGSGDGSYTNGHIQQIIADAAPQWFEFDQWTGAVAAVADIYSPTTTVTVTDSDITVSATCKPLLFNVTVTNGTASASSVTNAQVIEIYADAPATETNVFWRWEGSVAGVADIYAMTTTLTIAGSDVTLAAVYRHAPYHLTVTGGSGDGYHFAGEVVSIQAPAPTQHQRFLWQGPATFTDSEAWNTTLIMPDIDITVTATYPDREYNLTVVNGNGSGSYVNGTVVNVSVLQPPSELHQFERWSGAEAQLNDPLQQSTTFTVNGADAVIYPLYQPLPAVKGEYMVLNFTQSSTLYTVTYLDQPPAGGWDNSYKDTKMVLRRILPGTFQMGTGDNLSEDIHWVTLTEAFYIGIFEVTQGQWDNVMDTYPSSYSGSERDAHPVENISYDDIRGDINGRDWPADRDVDADSFIGMMRIKTGSDGFDLPTEAQWEYACRAGTSGNWNVDVSELFDVAIVSTNGQPTMTAPATVGSLEPNAWGLYDTHGNVFECCLDWYLVGIKLGSDVQTDPVGAEEPDTFYRRIIRGGSFDLVADPYTKAGYRNGQPTNTISPHTGLRLIKTAGVPHTLTLIGSKVNTGGIYRYRTQIPISAVDESGQIFECWLVEPADAFAGALFNADARDTIITMPKQDITVTAQYR